MAVTPRDVRVSEGGEVRPQVVGVVTGGSREVERRSVTNCLRGRGRARARLPPGPAEGREDVDEAEETRFLEPEALSFKDRAWAATLVLGSSLDLLGSACLSGFAFKYAYRNEGISLACLGVQALSHLFSSLVLVMRFMAELLPPREDVEGGVSDACLLREQRRRDLRREQAFAIAMGVAMMLSSAGLGFKAFRKIQFWDQWYLDHSGQDEEVEKVTDLMAWWGFTGYSVQAMLRFAAAWKIRRSVIWHGFTVSTVSLVFFLFLGLAASYEREWSWKAEPVTAIGLVFVMFCESVRMVILHLGDVELRMGHDPRA